jgi:drug/metabolite transporter (DMT)-like permease
MNATAGNQRMGGLEWALLLILSALWGGSFFFFKVLLADYPPLIVVLGRVGLAAIALNSLLLIRRDPMPASMRLWRQFLAIGLLNNVLPFTLIVFGETRISSGLASILNATTPIFTVLAAQVFTTVEKITWAKGVGVLFGFLGAAVLVGPDLLAGSGRGDVIGEMSCLLAAASYALAGIYGRRFCGIAPVKIATGQITASTAVLVPLALLIDRPWLLPPPTAATWAAWLSLALLCTALAYLIYFRILATAGATNLLLVTFLLPVSALLLGAAFLGENVSLRSLAGMALIGLGLAAIDGRIWDVARRRRRPVAPVGSTLL